MPPKSGATGPKPKKSTPKSTKTTELNNASEASPSEEKPSSSKKTSATKKVSATKKAAATPAKSSGSKKTSEVKTSSPKVSAEVKPEGAKAAASETKRSGAKKTTAKAASTTKKASGTKTTSTKATVAKSASVAKTAPAASPVKKTRTVKATAAKKTVTSKVSKTAKAKENDAVEAMVPTDNLVVPNPEVVPEIVEVTPAVAPVEKVKKTRAVSKKTPKKAPKAASTTTTKKTTVRRTRKPPTIGDTPLTPEQVEEFKNSLTGSYKFSVPSMLTLLEVFSTRGSLKDEEGMKVVGVETTKRYNEYRNFLFTGSLISYEQPVFVKTADLDALWTALRNQDAKALCNSLMKVPSFKHFLKGLKMSAAVRPGDIPEISKSAFPTYCTLVEITAQGLTLSSEGVYATPVEPSVEDFAKMARDVYKNLSAKKDKAVSAGLWLETMAKSHGVHPFVSRRLLEEAQEQSLLKYALEENVGGPSALPKKVTVYRIGRKENIPVLEQANLYSGDFFSANKIAVNLRLETKSK